MIVCHDPKFVFVHIPRTGGTSLTNWLMQTFGMRLRQIHQQHSSLNALSLEELEKYTDYWKFTVVRHPVDRLASWYRHSRSDKSLIDYYSSLKDKQFFLNQLDYITQPDGSLWTDDVFRFENLAEDIQVVAQKLGLSSLSMPHINGGKLGLSVSADEEDFLRGACERDLRYFRYFGYE